jgi:hypothetical protein
VDLIFPYILFSKELISSYVSRVFSIHETQRLLVGGVIVLGCHNRAMDGDRCVSYPHLHLVYYHACEAGAVDLADPVA